MESTPTCYRHPKLEAHLRCSRCERHICGACSNPGSVGQHCPSCVKEQGTQKFIRAGGSKDVFAGAPMTRAILVITVLVSVADFFGLIDGWVLTHIPEAVAAGEWWRLLSHALVHGGYIHLAFNMYALYLLGIAIEKSLGALPFLALYIFSSVMAGVVIFYLSPFPTVGASGAIYGLFGFWLGNALAARRRGLGNSQLRRIGPILLINLVISLVPGISWQGHLGGLVGGVLAYGIWMRVRDPKQRSIVLFVLSILLVVVTQVVRSGAV